MKWNHLGNLLREESGSEAPALATSHKPNTTSSIIRLYTTYNPYLLNTFNRYPSFPIPSPPGLFIAYSAVPSSVLSRHLYSLLCTTLSSLNIASSAGLSRPLSISSAGLHLAYF
jgi:hypothetical protein